MADLYKMLRALYLEKEKLEYAISQLEGLQTNMALRRLLPPPGKRRGRKSMSDAERHEVSQRMRGYWERRRTEITSLSARPDAEAI